MISLLVADLQDPPTSTIFSKLVASTANTNTFITSVLSVMETYAFDVSVIINSWKDVHTQCHKGIDIDWEVRTAFPGEMQYLILNEISILEHMIVVEDLQTRKTLLHSWQP